MSISTPNRTPRYLVICATALSGAAFGCAGRVTSPARELITGQAIERYRAVNSERLESRGGARAAGAGSPGFAWPRAADGQMSDEDLGGTWPHEPTSTFGSYPSLDDRSTSSQPASVPSVAAAPAAYWKDDVFDQAGSELKALVTRDFWRGYKTALWDVENAIYLVGTMGASIAVRESGVDETVRRRVRGHRQLGDLDETLQILGNPGTHFLGAGALWLTSTLTKDLKQHEVSKKLTQALAVNGVTTLLLKASANTRGPDGDRFAWPSGHTSSAFTVAAVVNEYYGPLAGIPSLALAGLIGYQRIDARSHDLSDVIFGGMLGYIIGSSIARDGKAEFPEVFGMTLIPYSDPQTGAAGLALMKQF